METRVLGSLPRPSSAGGTALPTLMIVPSAGATASPSCNGTIRSGSRKKNMSAAVAIAKSSPKVEESRNATTVAAAAIATNL